MNCAGRNCSLGFCPIWGPRECWGRGKKLYIIIHHVTLATMYSKAFTCVSGCVARGWGKMNWGGKYWWGAYVGAPPVQPLVSVVLECHIVLLCELYHGCSCGHLNMDIFLKRFVMENICSIAHLQDCSLESPLHTFHLQKIMFASEKHSRYENYWMKKRPPVPAPRSHPPLSQCWKETSLMRLVKNPMNTFSLCLSDIFHVSLWSNVRSKKK